MSFFSGEIEFTKRPWPKWVDRLILVMCWPGVLVVVACVVAIVLIVAALFWPFTPFMRITYKTKETK